MSTLPEPYPDLYAAIAAWFAANAVLQPLFPGGIQNSRKLPNQGFPYVRVAWSKVQPGLSVDDEQYLVTLSAYAVDTNDPNASTDDVCAAAGETLVQQFMAPGRPVFAFTDADGQAWTEGMKREQTATGPDVVDTISSVDGGPEGYVWRYRAPIEVWMIAVPSE